MTTYPPPNPRPFGSFDFTQPIVPGVYPQPGAGNPEPAGPMMLKLPGRAPVEFSVDGLARLAAAASRRPAKEPLGMTPRGRNAVGGPTLFPNMNAPGFGGYGGGTTKSETIGPGSVTGNGRFHDTFGSNIADIKAHGPMASMAADLNASAANSAASSSFTGTPYEKKPMFRFDGTPMAEGGPVTGPGGPKDDKIPAKLSAGEFVMPAETVKFFGLDRLNKMIDKAKEGMMEMDMPMMKPGTMPMMPKPGTGNREPGTMPMMPMKMAEGGPVPFLAPWEKDQQRAAEIAAANPMPGVTRTAQRRFAASPQGMELSMRQAAANQAFQQEQAARAAAAASEQAFILKRDALRDAAARDRDAVQRNYDLADYNMRLASEAALHAAREKEGSITEGFQLPMEGGSVPMVRTAGGTAKMAGGFMPAPKSAPTLDMQPVPGSNLFLPTFAGRPVSGAPMFEGSTQRAPFPEGLSRTTLKPVAKEQPKAKGIPALNPMGELRTVPPGYKVPEGWTVLEEDSPTGTPAAATKAKWQLWSAGKK